MRGLGVVGCNDDPIDLSSSGLAALARLGQARRDSSVGLSDEQASGILFHGVEGADGSGRTLSITVVVLLPGCVAAGSNIS